MEPVFNNSAAYHPGLLVELLKESYKNIPSTKDSWMDNIRGFDAQVSAHPQWIGKYVFITTFQGKPIGFVSFDPRKKPLAEIGHNCILPEYRGNGYGKSQIQHALGEIKKQGFTKVIVSTNKNDDFIPAQRQYIACGFHETGDFIREDGDLMIGYELMF